MSDLAERIRDYLPSEKELAFYQRPGPHEKAIQKRRASDQQNPSYALVQRDDDPTRFVMVPQHHSMNLYPPEAPGPHYSQVAFDGEALYPQVDGDGKLVGANMALFGPRSERFIRSVLSLGVGEFSDSVWQALSQAVLDLAAISARDMVGPDGKVARLYVRRAGERRGKFGVTPKLGDRVHLTVNMWRWPFYLPEEVYTAGATVAAFFDAQRLTELHGKVAGNYSVGHLGKRAAELGAHEVVFWGPFTENESGKDYVNYQQGPDVWKRMRKDGLIVDGAGEDIVFEHNDGRLFLVPKKDTNILAGTTRGYIGTELAPKLGIDVTERTVTMREIDNGSVVGMALLGNAVMVAPVTRIIIAGVDGKEVDRVELQLTPGIEAVKTRYADELHGRIKPSGDLLTAVDLNQGKVARQVLDGVFSKWL